MSLLPSYIMHLSCSLQGLSLLFDKGKAWDNTEHLCFSYAEILLFITQMRRFSKSENGVNYEVPERYNGPLKKNSEVFR